MKLHFFHRFNKKPHIALFFIILLFGNCKKDVPDNVIEIEYLQSNILYDNEGNIYKTVVIGNQEWMAENLNTSVHTYGYSNCYGDLPENCTKYGRLYTIEAVMNGQPPSLYNPSGIRGICPAGWHIPSDAEWRQLEVFLGMTPDDALSTGWRGTDQGTKLKSVSGWINNGNGTNNYGFTALPGGQIAPVLGWTGLGSIGGWWTSSAIDGDKDVYRSLKNNQSCIYRSSLSQNMGFSVRCVKN